MSGSERSSSPTGGLTRPGQRRKGSGRPGMRIWVLVVLVVAIVLGLVAVSVNAAGKVGSQGAQGARRPLQPPTALYASGTSDGAVLLSWQPSQVATKRCSDTSAITPHGYWITCAMMACGDLLRHFAQLLL